MVKHNNVVPNQHFKKDWQEMVRVTLEQPMRKLRRRKARKAKAQAIAPRPLGVLRPAVRCPTKRYHTKVRIGRGFTLDELKEAGINRKLAKTIGIAVDFRRKNRSVPTLQANVQRLKEYKARLIVFPRKAGKVKKGDSSVEETSVATQFQGKLLPLTKAKPTTETMTITDEMKSKSAVYQLKQAAATKYLEGKKKWAKEEED